VPCVIIDPREVQHAPTQRLVLERNRILRGALSPFVEVSSLAAFNCEQTAIFFAAVESKMR
jgi:hypothetical protein